MALGKWQTREFTSWKGLTQSNHLYSIYGANQNKGSEVMIRLLDHNQGKSLESYLNKFPIKYFDDDSEIVWKLIGDAMQNVALYEAQDEDGNIIGPTDMAGKNGSPFYLFFREDLFADGNTLWGEKNEVYPLRIIGHGEPYNNLVRYKVELLGGITSGMPGEEVQLGKRFSNGPNYVENGLSRKVGDLVFSSPIAMRNEFSTIRLQHKVSGEMYNKKIACGIPIKKNDSNGKSQVQIVNKWILYVDWEMEQQFSRDKNFCIVYGTSNRTSNGEYLNIGKSGREIRTGAGIREQMQYANTTYYNEFDLKLIEEALFDLSVGVLDFKDRVFVLETGERGAALFSKAVLNQVSGWSAFLLGSNNPAVINKTTSNLHTNALSAGFQFVEYKAPNGVVVKVNINSMNDDPVRNKIEHPLGGLAESYRFDIYYLGNSDQPNIQIARVKGSGDIRGIRRGMRDPFSGVEGGLIATDEDATTIHKMTTLGAMVLDPNRTISLIPAVLQ